MINTFFPLTVASIHPSTPESVVVEFAVPESLRPQFAYQQGQYLTLRTTLAGEEVRRSYSLCSSPLDQEWKVGIKKVPGGKFSTFAHETLKVGDQLEVRPAQGRFFVEVDPQRKRNYLAFAAGSGITPVFSIIKTHLQAEPRSTFKLFFINRSVASIMLKEELEALKNQYMERLEIFYFLTQEYRDVPLFNGRLDPEKLEIIFKTICDLEEVDACFLCGPEQMILSTREFLLKKGFPKKDLHFELFHAEGAQPEVRQQISEAFAGKQSEVTILEGGKSFRFQTPQGKESILDAALRNAADLPFACKGGVCCTCRAKLVEGEVKMLVHYGLEEEEIAAGYILTCQALPVSDSLTIDFDS